MDIVEHLKRLKALREQGIISESDYNYHKQILLGQLYKNNPKNIYHHPQKRSIGIRIVHFVGTLIAISIIGGPIINGINEYYKEKYRNRKNGYISAFSYPSYVSIADEARMKNAELQEEVEIIEQHDCGDGKIKDHQVCGTLENKSYGEKNVTIYADYYDKNDVKLETHLDFVQIESYGKSKFSTLYYSGDEPFDHYKLMIKVTD